MHFFLLLLLTCWRIDGAQAAEQSQAWAGMAIGGKTSLISEEISGTLTDVSFSSVDAPAIHLSYERLIHLFHHKALLHLRGNFSQANFEGHNAIRLPDGKIFLYDLSADLKMTFSSQKKSKGLLGPIFLLGTHYATLPILVRPAISSGNFSYEKVSALYPTLGVGSVYFLWKGSLRGYIRAGLPVAMGGATLNGGSYASLDLEYTHPFGRSSAWAILGSCKYSTLSFDRSDSLTQSNLEHKARYQALSLAVAYLYGF